MAWVWSGRTMAVSAGGLGVRGRGTRLGFPQGLNRAGVRSGLGPHGPGRAAGCIAGSKVGASRAPEAAGRNLEASAFARRCGRGAPPSASTG